VEDKVKEIIQNGARSVISGYFRIKLGEDIIEVPPSKAYILLNRVRMSMNRDVLEVIESS
jgi:hypothetical protein